ncbi:MAG: RNA-guided pseudouridylation complex pseudouridine synthase subunit Cbf5 [Nanobdellota archaeon]
MGLLPFEKIDRQVLVRQQPETDVKFGKKPSERSVEELLDFGIINVDKPRGPTSHQVSSFVQHILNIKKSGHSGTLDPKVTGILPVALGRGTRIVQSLLTAGKEYVCLMHLHGEVERTRLEQCIKEEFTGKIKQTPPAKSAVKRRPRFRKIYYFQILEIKGSSVLFKAGTQAGTYIRKLCHDIGERLGVGAHMEELRRTKAGPFQEKDQLMTLQDLKDAFYYYQKGDETRLQECIQPIENGVRHLPSVWVADTTVNSLCNGASLKVPGIVKVESDIQVGEFVAVKTLKGELVMVAKSAMISKEMVKESQGVACRPEQVFMKPGIYPKIERP